jgi:NagD protein
MMDKQYLDWLQSARAFMFDMDGTLVLGDKHNRGLRPLPGALELLQRLEQSDIPYAIMTNGTARTPEDYAPHLREAGFNVHPEQILTPSSVAADYFLRRKYRRILVLGCEGVWRPLTAAGIEVILPSAHDPGPVDAVYVGWYREFTLDDLDIACDQISQGARLYSVSMVPFFAGANGRILSSSYVIAEMIKRITQCRVTVLGKPSLEAMRCVSRRLGVPMKKIAVVGDDPQLEVAMARRAKTLSIAVTTGLNSAADFEALPEHKRPHLILQGVDKLNVLYRRLG